MNASLREHYKMIAALPISHPARKFLDELCRCQAECVGRDIPWKGQDREAVDQRWYSEAHGYWWDFSGFAYMYVVNRCERLLDAWVEQSPRQSEHETEMISDLPRLRTMLDECVQAAENDGNHDVVRMAGLVRSLFDRAAAAISARMQMHGDEGK